MRRITTQSGSNSTLLLRMARNKAPTQQRSFIISTGQVTTGFVVSIEAANSMCHLAGIQRFVIEGIFRPIGIFLQVGSLSAAVLRNLSSLETTSSTPIHPTTFRLRATPHSHLVGTSKKLLRS